MKLFQDAQFKPTQGNVAALLALYGLELASFKMTKLGIENCTFFIEAKTGKFVARVYRQNKKSDADIQQELSFMAYLNDHNIPVAMPLQNSRSELLSHLSENGHQWQAILMHRMPGEHAQDYTEALIANLATTQARMHKLAASYKTYQAIDENLRVLQETHFIKLIKNREQLDERRQAFIDRAEKYKVTFRPELPIGLCHLDFDNDNVLTKNNAVTAILDFDDLSIAPYVMCLSYALWTITYDIGSEGLKQYMHAYEKIRLLSYYEKEYIKPLLLFRHYIIGCIQFADEAMDDETFKKYLDLEREFL